MTESCLCAFGDSIARSALLSGYLGKSGHLHTGCPVKMDNLGQTPFEAHRVNFFIWLFYDEMTVRALGYYEVLKKNLGVN